MASAYPDSNFVDNFSQLAKLLGDPSDDRVDPSTVSRASKPGPAGVGPQGIFPGVKIAEPKELQKKSNEIWTEEEVDDGVEDDCDDGRTPPQYEFIYKQAVETTDAFLGMSGKDASSACCEDLVLKVKLPDVEKATEIDVDLKAASIRLVTLNYKLSTYLPHPVDEKHSKAQWDSSTHTLSITMRIVRDEDYGL